MTHSRGENDDGALLLLLLRGQAERATGAGDDGRTLEKSEEAQYQYYTVRGHVHYIPIRSLSLLVSCVSRGQDWIARYGLDF